MTRLSPSTAARNAAPYLNFDPSLFLDQAATAGMVVFTNGELIHYLLIEDARPEDADRAEFRWALMKASGSGKAIRRLLIERGLVCASRCGS